MQLHKLNNLKLRHSIDNSMSVFYPNGYILATILSVLNLTKGSFWKVCQALHLRGGSPSWQQGMVVGCKGDCAGNREHKKWS